MYARWNFMCFYFNIAGARNMRSGLRSLMLRGFSFGDNLKKCRRNMVDCCSI
nr:hypothetical protein Iba_scaffold76846CG0010 [Ipomoea batatas]